MEASIEGTKSEKVSSPSASAANENYHAPQGAAVTAEQAPPPGKGLSALAQQLRALQAKNRTLTVEIGRLERQLRIVTELSGVSVTDLRGTLERACMSEANGELQHRLALLQAQLEEAKLKHRKAEEFDLETEDQKTANLQLQIGELEETEGALRLELGQVYKAQDEQAEEATKLRETNDQQTNEINNLKEELQQLKMENEKLGMKVKETATVDNAASSRKLKDPPAHRSAKHAPSKAKTGTKAIPVAVKAPPVRTKARQLNADSSTNANAPIVTEKAPQPPITLGPPDAVATVTPKPPPQENMESKHIQLLRKQVESREKDLELKESQYKSRFSLQEERIIDMEQQLSSMYTAFELIDQEHSQEKRNRDELTQALRMADSQVARAVDHLQRNNTSPAATAHATTTTPAASPARDSGEASSETISVATSYSTQTDTLNNLSRSPSSTPKPTPSSGPTNEVIISGYVMKRGRLNRWKKQYATLSRSFTDFQLRLSEGPKVGGGSRKKPYLLTVFRSTFEATKDFPNYPYCFRIKTDVHDKNAPEVVLAVRTEEEFHQWLVGLHEAVDGANAPVPPDAANAPPAQNTPMIASPAPSAVISPRRTDETQSFEPGVGSSTEEDDLAIALVESLRESEEHAKESPEPQESASPRPNMPHEETKEEIGDASNRSEAELEAALAESLRVSSETHGDSAS